MRNKNSFWALLGRNSAGASERVTEKIRLAMLSALDRHCDQEHARVDESIQRAKDVAELWYLRPDLMHAIASCRGESVAQRVMDEVTELYRGHHPGVRASRFGSL